MTGLYPRVKSCIIKCFITLLVGWFIFNYIENYLSQSMNNGLKKEKEIPKNGTVKIIENKTNDETASAKIQKFEYDRARDGSSIDTQNAEYPNFISEICARYNLTTKLVKRNYLQSPDNAMLYCWIRKIASTSFTKLFSDLRRRGITKDYYKEVDILSPKTIDDLKGLIKDDRVFKFMLIRHPFERIVSTYRDRIEDNTKYTAQAWIYAPKIFRLTRPHLFYSNKSMGSPLNRIFNNDRRLKLVPRFDEYIDWLLETPTSTDDVHWESYYSHCSMCIVDYDSIIKLENYSQTDMDLIFRKMSIDKTEIEILNLEKTRGGSTNYNETCKYLKTLGEKRILKLYQRYRIDFQMFNYNYENYINCTNLI